MWRNNNNLCVYVIICRVWAKVIRKRGYNRKTLLYLSAEVNISKSI